jgi:single-strand DNA-binding protein
VANVARITLVGNVGSDAELRMTPNGTAVADFSVAVNQKRGANESTDWFRVSCWGKQAEIAQQYVRKGGQVFVIGRFQPRTYTAKDGSSRVSYDVTADDFQLLGGRQASGAAPAASSDFDPDSIPF